MSARCSQALMNAVCLDQQLHAEENAAELAGARDRLDERRARLGLVVAAAVDELREQAEVRGLEHRVVRAVAQARRRRDRPREEVAEVRREAAARWAVRIVELRADVGEDEEVAQQGRERAVRARRAPRGPPRAARPPPCSRAG